MNTQLLQLIINLGLSTKEAKVYLAILELSSEVASKIATKAKVDRVNTYNMLDSLKKRGLISEIEKSGVKYFSAESPVKLKEIGERTKQDIETNLLDLVKLLPELMSLYNTGSIQKPRVRFYEGQEGYLTVYEQILKDHPTEFLVLIDYQKFTKLIDLNYEKEWIERRIKLGIQIRWIDLESAQMKQERAKNDKKLREIRFLPSNYKLAGGLFIYQQKLILLSIGEEFVAIIIENQEFATLGKTIFEILWNLVAK